MGLLTVTKYPASLAFLMLALGANGVLLGMLARATRRGSRVSEFCLAYCLAFCLAYGRAPLFFYVAHLYVFALVGLLPGHLSLMGMYGVWALGVAALYLACLRYNRFKRGKPADSIWRLF